MRSVLVLLPLVSAVATAAPMEIAHQGRLFDASGAPLTGAHTLHLSLYTSATASSPVFADSVPSELANGYFAVTIGADSTNPLDDATFDGSPIWLGLKVGDGAELAERIPVSTLPHSAFARRAAFATAAGTATTATSLEGGAVNATEVRVNNIPVITATGQLAPGVLGPLDESAIREAVTFAPIDLATSSTIGGKHPVYAADLNGLVGTYLSAAPTTLHAGTTLAGASFQAIGSRLRPLTRSADFTVSAADEGALFMMTNPNPATVSLPAAAAVPEGFTVAFKAQNRGLVTIDGAGAETIDGLATIRLPWPTAAAAVTRVGAGWVVTAAYGDYASTFEYYEGTTIAVSGTYQSNTPPTAATMNDGDLTTCWGSAANSVGQWIRADLGAPKVVRRVAVAGGTWTAANWQNVGSYLGGALVQYSQDGTGWVTVAALPTVGETAVTEIPISPIVARYVRISKDLWLSTCELRIGG